MYAVEACDRFDFGSDEYRALFAKSTGTLFQHPVWLDALYTVLAPAIGAEPLVVTIRAAPGGPLVGVLPLVRKTRGLFTLVEFADLGVSDYAVPVVERTAAAAMSADPAIGSAIRTAIGPVDLVRVNNVPRSADLVRNLLGASSVRQHEYHAYAIPLPDSFADWRDQRDPEFTRHLDNKRQRIGRKRRVLGLHEVTTATEVDEMFDLMRTYRGDRFSGRRAVDLMQDERYFEFYRTVARRGAVGDGPASTTVLTIDDAPVGVSFGLSDAVTDLFVLIGYDVATWRNYSLGLVMVEELIERSIRTGKQVHDLTVGHGDYKGSFGAVPSPMFSVRLAARPTGRGALAVSDANRVARRTAKKAVAHWNTRHPNRPLGPRITTLLTMDKKGRHDRARRLHRRRQA